MPAGTPASPGSTPGRRGARSGKTGAAGAIQEPAAEQPIGSAARLLQDSGLASGRVSRGRGARSTGDLARISSLAGSLRGGSGRATSRKDSPSRNGLLATPGSATSSRGPRGTRGARAAERGGGIATARPSSALGFLEADGGVRIAAGKRTVRLCYPKRVLRELTGQPTDFCTQAPNQRLQLDWVYGFSGVNGGCMFVVGANELLYPAAACVVLYNLEKDTQRFFTGHDDLVTALAVHSGEGLAVSGQRLGRGGTRPHASLWRTTDQQEVARLAGHDRQIGCVAFDSEAAHVFVSGVNNQGACQVCVWSVEELRLRNPPAGQSGSGLSVALGHEKSVEDHAAHEPLFTVPLQSLESVQGLHVHPLQSSVALAHSSHTLSFVVMPSLKGTLGAKNSQKPYVRLAEYDSIDLPAGIACTAFLSNIENSESSVCAAVGTTDGRFLLFSEHDNGAWRATTSLWLTSEPSANCRVDFIKATSQGFICGGGAGCGLTFFSHDLQPMRKQMPFETVESRTVQIVDAVFMEGQDNDGGMMVFGTCDGTLLHVERPYARLQDPSLVGVVLVGPHGGSSSIVQQEHVVNALASHPLVETRVASGDTLGRIFFHDTGTHRTFRAVPPYRCQSAVGCLSYAPGGGLLLAGLVDGTLELILATEWAELFVGSDDALVRQDEFAAVVAAHDPDLPRGVMEQVWSVAVGASSNLGVRRGDLATLLRTEAAAVMLRSPNGFASLPRLYGSVRICGEGNPITAVDFAPPSGSTSQMQQQQQQQQLLAVASADGTVTLLSFALARMTGSWEQQLQLEQRQVIRAGNAMVLAMQFSVCGNFLATSSRDAPLVFWRVEAGQRLNEAAVQEVEWFRIGAKAHQWRLPIGWPVLGLCSRSHANPNLMVQSARRHSLCVVSSDHFDVGLHRFPMPLEAARGNMCFQHGGRVVCCCWTGQDQLLTASSRCSALLQWRLTSDAADVRISDALPSTKESTPYVLGAAARNLGVKCSEVPASGEFDCAEDAATLRKADGSPEMLPCSDPEPELADSFTATTPEAQQSIANDRGREPEPEEASTEIDDVRRQLFQALQQNEDLLRRNSELARQGAEHAHARLKLEREKSKIEEHATVLRRMVSGASMGSDILAQVEPVARPLKQSSSVSIPPMILAPAAPRSGSLVDVSELSPRPQRELSPRSGTRMVRMLSGSGPANFSPRSVITTQSAVAAAAAAAASATGRPTAISRLPSSPPLGFRALSSIAGQDPLISSCGPVSSTEHPSIPRRLRSAPSIEVAPATGLGMLAAAAHGRSSAARLVMPAATGSAAVPTPQILTRAAVTPHLATQPLGCGFTLTGNSISTGPGSTVEPLTVPASPAVMMQAAWPSSRLVTSTPQQVAYRWASTGHTMARRATSPEARIPQHRDQATSRSPSPQCRHLVTHASPLVVRCSSPLGPSREATHLSTTTTLGFLQDHISSVPRLPSVLGPPTASSSGSATAVPSTPGSLAVMPGSGFTTGSSNWETKRTSSGA